MKVAPYYITSKHARVRFVQRHVMPDCTDAEAVKLAHDHGNLIHDEMVAMLRAASPIAPSAWKRREKLKRYGNGVQLLLRDDTIFLVRPLPDRPGGTIVITCLDSHEYMISTSRRLKQTTRRKRASGHRERRSGELDPTSEDA